MSAHLIEISDLHTSARKIVELGILQNRKALRSFSSKLCSNKSDCEDLVQDTICNALAASHTYDATKSMISWLFSIMKHANIDNFRRSKGDERTGNTAMPEGQILPPSYHWTSNFHRVAAAMDRMSDVKRAAIIQIACGGDYASSAVICGCDVNTLKTRVRRARHELMVEVGDMFASN